MDNKKMENYNKPRPPIIATGVFLLIIITWIIMTGIIKSNEVTTVQIILISICFVLIAVRWVLFVLDKKKEEGNELEYISEESEEAEGLEESEETSD